MPSYHAKLSPSSADRWTSCSASINAQDGIVDEGSEAARDGTCCHQIMAECLIARDKADLQSYLGRKMLFWQGPEAGGEVWADDEPVFGTAIRVTAEVIVTEAMLDAVHSALNFVHHVWALKGGLLEVEQRVPIGHITGEEGAGGTSDVTIIGDDYIHVLDAKFGRQKVMAYEVLTPAHDDIITGEPVPARVRPNLQMSLYALGAMEKFKDLGDFKTVTMTIVQPFVQHVSEYTCPVEELEALSEWLSARAEDTRVNPQFVPSPDNCHFCKASGDCPAQDAKVLSELTFDDEGVASPKYVRDLDLGAKLELVPMLKDWAKAVEQRAYDAVKAGLKVYGPDGLPRKLVIGKKGDREWRDLSELEDRLVKMRLPKEITHQPAKPKTPAQMEALAKAKRPKKGEKPVDPPISDLRWRRLQELIHQSEGKPVLALGSDPRPAVADATDGFDDLGSEPNSDLF